jgi:hypothetical protein
MIVSSDRGCLCQSSSLLYAEISGIPFRNIFFDAVRMGASSRLLRRRDGCHGAEIILSITVFDRNICFVFHGRHLRQAYGFLLNVSGYVFINRI